MEELEKANSPLGIDAPLINRPMEDVFAPLSLPDRAKVLFDSCVFGRSDVRVQANIQGAFDLIQAWAESTVTPLVENAMLRDLHNAKNLLCTARELVAGWAEETSKEYQDACHDIDNATVEAIKNYTCPVDRIVNRLPARNQEEMDRKELFRNLCKAIFEADKEDKADWIETRRYLTKALKWKNA